LRKVSVRICKGNNEEQPTFLGVVLIATQMSGV
jgi:hypothetical protein